MQPLGSIMLAAVLSSYSAPARALPRLQPSLMMLHTYNSVLTSLGSTNGRPAATVELDSLFETD